jgi:NAD(P)-dependent dehydrogenase (short-subunit alcohol dehydrogenase family)
MPDKNLFDLTGKIAIVTGGSRGIGRAICERLAQHGASVVVSSRKIDACEDVAKSIRATGGTAMALGCNISRKEDVTDLVKRTLETWGRVDILVCNAAVNPHLGPSRSITDEVFDKVMSSNIKSNLWLCHLAAPDMEVRKSGSIIIVSSIGGLRGTPVLGAYAISKAADMQLVRNLAVEFGPNNIRINAIAPGLIRTDFARALWENRELYEKRTRDTPMKRIGEPDEVAGAAVFLASDASSFITGQTLVIDGGVLVSPP